MNATLVRNMADKKTFPSLNAGGLPVNSRDHIEPGTKPAVFLAYLAAGLGVLIGGLVSYGILWIVLVFAPLIDYLNRKKAMALLKGTAIQVGPAQFKELHQCAETIAQRLGMKSAPDIYVIEGNVINAAAMRVAGRQVIVLQDDLVDACLRSGDDQTLTFILSHEMAHHALGHTGLIRSNLARAFKKLSRLNEHSCDAVANAVVGDMDVSTRAIAILATGPQLIPYLNFDALIAQAQQVAADRHSKKAERKLTHPLLLHRLSRFTSELRPGPTS